MRIQSRKNRHFNDLKNNCHHSPYLQRAFNKYGIDKFSFEIIENINDKIELLNREQWHLDNLSPHFNNSKSATSSYGTKQRPDVILKNKIRNSGFGNGNCKLKKELVDQIISLKTVHTCVELAKMYGVHRSTVERALKKHDNGKGNRVYSLVGRNKISEFAKKRRNRALSVNKYSLDMSFICSYPSGRDAAIKNNISLSQVFASCRGIVKKPRKFIFTFAILTSPHLLSDC